MITIKTPAEIEKMRQAGRITKEVLELVGRNVKPGISTKELVGAVDRASILLTEKNNVVKLNMDNDEVFVSSKSMEVGYVVEKLNEYAYEGEKLTISFSAKYLLDAIRALASEEISLHFTGDMKPIIIKSKTNPDLTQLILPVRMD